MKTNLTCVLALAIAAIASLLLTTAGAAAGPSVEMLYADANAKETAVRTALAAPDVSATVLNAVRTVIADYEALVRRFPTSAYCDDALWRGARLSLDAFERFGEITERTAGVRLLRRLVTEYPASKFAREASGLVAASTPATGSQSRPEQARPPRTGGVATAAPRREAGAGQVPTTGVVIPGPRLSASKPAAMELAPSRIVTITDIRRAVLPDAVRVIIELDGEVSFHDERLANPVRVFVDLPFTRPVAALVDRTIRFEVDADVVRQVRIGRHPNSTTRVVLDAADISSYSVYPLYSPFRLVIDCVRAVTPPPRSFSAPVNSPRVRPVAKAPLESALRAPVFAAALPAAGSVASAEIRVARAEESRLPLAAAPSTPSASSPVPMPASPPARNLAGGFSIARQLGLGVSRIVIDPGHGGHDPGALGKGLTEAALVLDIALRLEKLLARVRGVDVILTRRTDEYLPLQARTAIANREGADLFLSIHANASSSSKAGGVETYFLNFATSASAAAIAARENAASGQSMGALPDFVKTIALNDKRDESRDFATLVQRAMIERLRGANKGLKDLGVKQAPFVVLIGAAMPSVLAEISFLTNTQEIRLLRGSAYRERIAEALFNAIRKYQMSLKTVGEVAQQ